MVAVALFVSRAKADDGRKAVASALTEDFDWLVSKQKRRVRNLFLINELRR